MAVSLLAISFDVKDVRRLSQFWAEVLDEPVNQGANDILRELRHPD